MRIEAGTGSRITAAEGVLMMTAAQESDSGNYTCRASNMAGEEAKSVWIVVSGNYTAQTWYDNPSRMRTISSTHVTVYSTFLRIREKLWTFIL